jgi:hypothetical protein
MRPADPSPRISDEEACRAARPERRERQAPPPSVVSNPFRRMEDRVVDREAELRRNLSHRAGR